MRNLVFALGISLCATASAFAGERQAQIKVSGLWCPSCSYMVGQAMEKAATAKVVGYSPAENGKTAVYTVKFDDAATKASEIAARCSTYGYKAVVLSVKDVGS